MNRVRSIMMVGALAVLTVQALAADATGKWTGKISVTLPPIPANAPEQQKAMVRQMVEQIGKARILLNLKKGGTYDSSSTGMPQNQSSGGKWTQKGNEVTLTPSKKPAQGPPSQSMTLSKDGKTMTLIIPTQGGMGGGKVVFTRG